MADINATDLTQETTTTMDGTEQFVMFDSAEGKRATIAAVGDYIIEKLGLSLNGKTQTVAAALASLNSEISEKADADEFYNLNWTRNEIPANADLNTYTTIGVYRSVSSAVSASLSNCPYTTSGFKLVVEYTSTYQHYVQTIKGINGCYMRTGFDNNGTITWRAWMQIYSTS